MTAAAVLDERFPERFPLRLRIQHILLIPTLLTLAVTGAAILSPDGPLGFRAAGAAHRGAAALLLAEAVYHVFYMTGSREGRAELVALLPSRADAGDFAIAVRFGLGLSASPPRFGKYGYPEKIQYWGAAGGIVLMAGSGSLYLADSDIPAWLPSAVIDLTSTFHGGPGLAAFLVLLGWHMYVAHARPSASSAF